jgi:hypothetical protein
MAWPASLAVALCAGAEGQNKRNIAANAPKVLFFIELPLLSLQHVKDTVSQKRLLSHFFLGRQ